jgi:hypothetical protein
VSNSSASSISGASSTCGSALGSGLVAFACALGVSLRFDLGAGVSSRPATKEYEVPRAGLKPAGSKAFGGVEGRVPLRLVGAPGVPIPGVFRGGVRRVTRGIRAVFVSVSTC